LKGAERGEEVGVEGRRNPAGSGERAPLEGVPRWPAAVALLAVGALYAAVSTALTPGPRLLVPVLVALLVAALMSAHVGGRRRLARRFALALVALVTIAVATSALLLILVSLGGGTPAPALLGDAALIWAMNVVTFAVWYWEIDGGGPASRYRDRHYSEDFLFPQMAQGGAVARGWSLGFVDYLFLAFNTSTAFSPTDTAILSRRAKVLTMAQSVVSLAVVAVLIGRAVNALASTG
jgi:uncharacterized membrane protein